MQNYISHIQIIILLFVLRPALGYSQTQQIMSLTKVDGLSDLLVNTIYKDSEGYIWFGTESAIDRFDGNTVVSFPLPKNASGKSRVNAILRIHTGSVFIGLQSGLSILSSDLSSPKAILKDKITFPVNALASDGVDRLFLATDRGLYQYSLKNEKLSKIALGVDGLKQDDIFSDLLQSGRNTLYVLSPKTLYRHNLVKNHTDSFPLPAGGLVGKMAVLDNKIYIAAPNGGGIPIRYGDFPFWKCLEIRQQPDN